MVNAVVFKLVGRAPQRLLPAISNCERAVILPIVVGRDHVRLVLASKTMDAFLRFVNSTGMIPPRALLLNASLVSSLNTQIELGSGPDMLLPAVH
jgi:hypothetical protein